MLTTREEALEQIVRTSSLMSEEFNFRTLVSRLVEQAQDVTRSDLSALYLHEDPEEKGSDLKLAYSRGRYDIPKQIPGSAEIADFIADCGEAVVLLERRPSPFLGLLLHSEMHSGMAIPIRTAKSSIGILFINSRSGSFYSSARFSFIESFTKLAGGMLHNARLFQEMKEYLRRIEELERYQESIFSSMTNLLITTDENGAIHYFNQAAAERMGFSQEDIGRKTEEFFHKRLGKKILGALGQARESKSEVLGIEGIYRGSEKEMDFSLNISPLTAKRGRYEGMTMLFTDQSREQELKSRMKVATEERRVIKDMFSRYMSNDLVQQLMDAPDLVKPGGDMKRATLFFADIVGYTSFSEGKEPAYIIELLNEFFSEAVEVVLRNKGYIDKFIGDCLMATWGVPLSSEAEDAYRAVASAVEIQQLVKSKNRNFFTGDAKNLRLAIGMHTGPLVAGNLGSTQRMDYTVIGDTVNLAARLEGVAGANEIIITQETMDLIGGKFKVEKRKPVSVKGKIKPIQIYNVVDLR
jgi:adenylate cyclase